MNPRNNWYIAVVKNTREHYRAALLSELGYECYVPTQHDIRVGADGRRRPVERIVIPARVFVRVTEQQRRRILRDNLVLRFMTDTAASTDGLMRRPAAIVPDGQMDRLKFMLFNADRPVTITSTPLHRGDRVRIARGRLQGLEGTVCHEPDGRTAIYVSLDILGTARVEVDRESVEEISRKIE